MIDIIANTLGIIGVGCIVTAFALMQMGRLAMETYRYQLLNLVGAMLIVVSLLNSWNLASFVIEVIWISVSLYGLIKLYRKRN